MYSSEECEAISELDLDPIKVKLMHEPSGEGWTLERANAVEVEYRRFLHLTKAFPNEEIAPVEDVDTFWHYHILDTMKYADDCQAVFGHFLHHFPYVGLRGDEDLADRDRSGDRMRALYEETFGDDYFARAIACRELQSIPSTGKLKADGTATAYSNHPVGTATATAYSNHPVGTVTGWKADGTATAYSNHPVGTITARKADGTATAYSNHPVGTITIRKADGTSTAYSNHPVGAITIKKADGTATAYSNHPVGTITIRKADGTATAYSNHPVGTTTAGKADGTATAYSNHPGGTVIEKKRAGSFLARPRLSMGAVSA
jgi:cytidine deaminase